MFGRIPLIFFCRFMTCIFFRARRSLFFLLLLPFSVFLISPTTHVRLALLLCHFFFIPFFARHMTLRRYDVSCICSVIFLCFLQSSRTAKPILYLSFSVLRANEHRSPFLTSPFPLFFLSRSTGTTPALSRPRHARLCPIVQSARYSFPFRRVHQVTRKEIVGCTYRIPYAVSRYSVICLSN